MGSLITFFFATAIILLCVKKIIDFVQWNLSDKEQGGGNFTEWNPFDSFYSVGQDYENFVNDQLLKLDIAHYKVVHNLLLPSNGRLNVTQIDHVVVSNYGIFCIETKSYQGWIFGNASQEYWTQVIFRHKERFYNPLLQNYAHVKAIKELLKYKYPRTQILSLVVFPKADKLQISGTNSVGYMDDILSKIEGYTIPILSNTKRDEIYEMLIEANISDKEVRKLHDQGVREIIK